MPRLLLSLPRTSTGHAVVLVLADVTGAALGEEMGGPSPHPAAALAPLPVQPGFGLLQVGGCQTWTPGSEAEMWSELLMQILANELRVIYIPAVLLLFPRLKIGCPYSSSDCLRSGLTEEQIYNKCCNFQYKNGPLLGGNELPTTPCWTLWAGIWENRTGRLKRSSPSEICHSAE